MVRIPFRSRSLSQPFRRPHHFLTLRNMSGLQTFPVLDDTDLKDGEMYVKFRLITA